MIFTKTYTVNARELRALCPLLKAGDRVVLSGTIYTARDAAHKRIVAALQSGETLPFDLNDAVIYYSGATPAPPDRPIGACGPTTSSRMDPFAPLLYDCGVTATIGKGERSQAVREAIGRNGGVYLCAIGGAGALAAQCVTACEVVAYEDLGCEAVKCLAVRDFPLIVAIDAAGGSLFA